MGLCELGTQGSGNSGLGPAVAGHNPDMDHISVEVFREESRWQTCHEPTRVRIKLLHFSDATKEIPLVFIFKKKGKKKKKTSCLSICGGNF